MIRPIPQHLQCTSRKFYWKKNILEGFQNTVMGLVLFLWMLYVYALIYHKELIENGYKVKHGQSIP